MRSQNQEFIFISQEFNIEKNSSEVPIAYCLPFGFDFMTADQEGNSSDKKLLTI